MKDLNILYINNTQIPSTKANAYQSLLMCEALTNQGANVLFLCRKNKSKNLNNEFLDKIEFLYNIKISFIIKSLNSIDLSVLKMLSEKYWNLLRSLSFAISVIAFFIIKKNKYEFVYSRDQFSCILLLFYRKFFFLNFRIYFEAHDFNKSIICIAKYLDGIICISKTLAPLYYKNKNIIILEDACCESNIRLIDDFSIGKSGIIKIVYVGNLFPWKGIFTLLDCLKYLSEEFELHIAGGSDELKTEFMKKIPLNIDSKIIYHGYVGSQHVKSLIAMADCCVIPNENSSKNDHTSPMKAFEYMASAKSIISSDLIVLKNLFLDNAIYFKVGNSKDLAKAIFSLKYRSDLKEMASGLREIAKRNTWDFRAKKFINWLGVDS